jgi:hypothetical protein
MGVGGRRDEVAEDGEPEACGCAGEGDCDHSRIWVGVGSKERYPRATRVVGQKTPFLGRITILDQETLIRCPFRGFLSQQSGLNKDEGYKRRNTSLLYTPVLRHLSGSLPCEMPRQLLSGQSRE